tara:strand:- start:8543 stop:10771 length:2229 start_codon:yes stop_codon:yes gene_type:complete
VAKKLETFTISIDLKGLKDLTGLQRQLKNLEKVSKPVEGSFKLLTRSIKDVSKFTPRTISQFKQKERTLKALREEVKAGGVAFKRLGREIEANRKKLQSFNQTQPKGGFFGRLKSSKFGVGGRAALGAMAGSMAGNFGATGQMALTGAALGGPAGAVAGAAVGGAIDTVKAASAAAKYAAQIGRLEIALKGVTKTQRDFSKAQKVISSVSKELNVPIGASTKQFTTLSASVIGAGGNVEDAEKVFRGVSEAIKATGGDAEDVQSAIRAMSQIFGKGKVSAEELQGQLGERLPGAVVKFATATGRTLPELQKDLRDGTVGLNDVMKFVIKLSDDHREAALKMADSGMDAGQKLTVAMQQLQLHLGRIMQPIGAFFQRLATSVVNSINRIIESLGRLFNIGTENQRTNLENKVKESSDAYTIAIRQGLDKSTDPRDKAKFNRIKGRRDIALSNMQDFYAANPSESGTAESNFDDPISQDKINEKLAKRQLQLGLITQEKFDALEIDREARAIRDEMIEIQGPEFKMTLDEIKAKLIENKNETYNFKEEFKKIAESAMDLNSQIGELAVNSINKLADGFVELAMTGKASFGELARSILADLQRMILKALFFKTLFAVAPGLEKFLGFEKGGVVEKNAKGNVFAQNKVVPYKIGGIVDRPTIFPMANGAGLMGEAGPEAIMPLKRGRNGKLGVESSGGIGNINVNVDASGSNVQSDSTQSAELGKMLGMAVQAELIRQKRPGGLLG